MTGAARPLTHLVERAGWGAATAAGRELLDRELQLGVAVHYSAMAADQVADHIDCARRVRAIQRWHMDHNGWADIAYNWLVCWHGVRYRGRGLGVRSAAQGTTVGNTRYHAVCFLGADLAGRQDVTPQALEAVLDCIAAVRAWAPHATLIGPHSSFHPTGCPGDELRAWIAGGSPEPGGQPTPPAPVPPQPVDWTQEVLSMLPLVDCRVGQASTSHGNYVRKVQGLLLAAGTLPLAVDGVVGPITQDRVMSYQRDHGLHVDGLVGRQTWTALLTR